MGVSDKEIKKVVNSGACSVDEVMRCTGAGTRCGTCVAEIASFVEEPSAPASAARRFLPICSSSNAA